jgi:RND family efflux transporter MFP subunit
VRQGQVLARIHAPTEQQAVVSAQAGLATARTELNVVERDAERTERLVQAGALAQRDLERARANVEAARARVAQAQATLTAAREQSGNAVVTAPMSGIVSSRAVDSGDVVTNGAELFTIVDPSRLELRAAVPAEDLSRIAPGVPVQFTVQGYPDRTFRGNVQRVNPAAIAETRQVEVFVTIPNPRGELLSGLYAEGRLATGVRQGVVVPEGAVVTQGETPYVIKVSGGKTERQPVRLGARDPRTGVVAVESGVSPGDLLLAGAALRIPPGTPVELPATAAADRSR